MVLSDKKFIEFSEQVWERNKELLAEKRELLEQVRNLNARIDELRRQVEFERAYGTNANEQAYRLKKDLEETNAEFNKIVDEQRNYILELERKLKEIEREDEEMEDCEREFKIFINPENGHVAVEDCDEFEDISDDWDDLFEDDLGPSDRFINCTFNLNFK